MSIRLRLALSYGTLFALLLPLVMFFSYAIHARGQYDDIDRVLITTVGHAAAELSLGSYGHHLVQGKEGLEVALRLYRADGRLLDLTRGTEALPSVDPRTVVQHPSGPAFDAIAQLVPPVMAPPSLPPGGAFGLVTTPEQRWRVYVLPIHTIGTGETFSGSIEAVTPLGRLDASMQALRLILPMLGLTSLLAALVGSWAIAGNALRPVARMIRTAQHIAQSRDLSRRIEKSPHQDELGRLAATFNEMLASIETAHRMQQRFVSDASHELRAPLTAIQGNLELLRRHQAMSETDREEALAEMERETDRLARLVADLLSLARADAGIGVKRCPLDLGAVVLDAFRTARQLARGHTLRLEPFEPVMVEGDEDRLKQLLLILLDNALKYTPIAGSVTLGVRRNEKMAEFLVRDTGIGISPEDLLHVFDRFYRADPARGRDPGGTGLGLSIAQWIVTQHEGIIAIASEPGQGTTVTVHIPLCLCPP